MKKSALHMMGVSSPMNQNNEKGEIKTWNEGQPNIIGSAGSLGAIGAGGIKLGVGLLKKGLSKIKGFFKPSLQHSSRPLIINNKVVKSYTPKKGTNPGSKPGRPPHEIYHTTKPKPRTKSSENVTPTGANPRSRIYGEHVSPKGETLGSYQYRSTGHGGGARVWEPTRTDRPPVGKFEKMAAEYLKKAINKGTATEAEKATWKIYNERISRPFLDL